VKYRKLACQTNSEVLRMSSPKITSSVVEDLCISTMHIHQYPGVYLYLYLYDMRLYFLHIQVYNVEEASSRLGVITGQACGTLVHLYSFVWLICICIYYTYRCVRWKPRVNNAWSLGTPTVLWCMFICTCVNAYVLIIYIYF